MAVGVEVGGVDEVATRVEVGEQDLFRFFDAAARTAGIGAESHGTQSKRTHAKT